MKSADHQVGDASLWHCGPHCFRLRRRVLVMGIVNVTTDSFSDGGLYFQEDQAVEQALQLVGDGADILDIGGESTRPGADPVPLQVELDRVVPVIRRLARETDIPISVDTCKAEVAREALAAGAVIINDVTALRGDPAMEEIAARSEAGIVLMHMIGTPRTMQHNPQYVDVVREVAQFLQERLLRAEAAGISRVRIALDPGIGFGKTFEHNLQLHRRMHELTALGRPLLVGPSRKAFIGKLLDLPVEQRVEGTAAAVALAIAAGARIIRVHDVRQMTRVAKVALALSPGMADE